MNPELSKHYKEIGSYIASAIDGAWHKAWIIAAVEEDYGTYGGRYYPQSSSDNLGYFEAIYIRNAFRAIWEIFKDEKGESWKSARFTLWPDGRFDLDFAYDDEKLGDPPLEGSE